MMWVVVLKLSVLNSAVSMKFIRSTSNILFLNLHNISHK
uniref:Uncharacterized protein n=1 Tax=Anguilla anguilla TaxID=7936 RepID=A0A0E9SPM0_ANGAN